jgi:hypothetical protein
MEQLDYNLLFRWFVGLNMDGAIWDVTVFTKNRERLLDGDIAEALLPNRAPASTRAESALGRTLHRGWNATESVGECEKLSAQGCYERRSGGRSWQCDGWTSMGEAVEPDARIEDRPGYEDGRQRQGQRSEARLSYKGNLLVENRNGLIVNTQVFEANGTA